MARPLRIQYEGAVYHITCRGNEQKEIFKDNEDRQRMLQVLIQSLKTYHIKLYSYVFMNNHIHLLIETPMGNLSEFMRQFNITYTGYYNRRHKRAGHLYQGRYKSILVDKAAYLTILSRYIHLNPVRVAAVKKKSHKEKVKHLLKYPWSSLQGYIKRDKRESFIDYGMVLEEYGGDTDRARRAYREAILRELKEGIEIKEEVFSQSILGRSEFIEWVKERFIDKERDIQEIPSAKEIRRYRLREDILRAIEEETGKDLERLRNEKGIYRQIAMELLYRMGGMKGTQIGQIMGIGYTAVSQERRRLGERLLKDKKLQNLMKRIEERL
jgi:REP element-mobilizing transposase RayT